MSKLNISRNIFLEKEELLRFQKFLGLENVSTQVLLENTLKWGIVRTTFDENYVDFKVELGTNLGTVQIANTSKAVDIDKLLIKLDPTDNIAIPSDGVWYWMKISHTYSPIEVGQCSVNVNGVVTGVDTKFTEILRGQSTEVPVKIKFVKNGLVNTETYEVVDVIDDLNLILSGTNFTAESALTYYVIGSTPVSEALTVQQLEGLYQYDNCLLEFIQEEILDTAPILDFVENKEFYIARVQKNGGSVTVQDKRGTQFLTFNVEGLSDKLDKAANLSDLTNKEEARANLQVLSASEIEANYFYDSGWQSMIKGVGASATNFDLKIRRIGKLCVINGRFGGGANMNANAIIASIPYSSINPIGTTLKPMINIYVGSAADVDDRRLKAFIPAFVSGDTSLFIKMLTTQSETPDATYLINLSFYVD